MLGSILLVVACSMPADDPLGVFEPEAATGTKTWHLKGGKPLKAKAVGFTVGGFDLTWRATGIWVSGVRFDRLNADQKTIVATYFDLPVDRTTQDKLRAHIAPIPKKYIYACVLLEPVGKQETVVCPVHVLQDRERTALTPYFEEWLVKKKEEYDRQRVIAAVERTARAAEMQASELRAAREDAGIREARRASRERELIDALNQNTGELRRPH